MNVWDEIAVIRADLNTVDQTIARLTERLSQIEVRQRALDRAERVANKPEPPPLPKVIQVPPRQEKAPAPVQKAAPVSSGTGYAPGAAAFEVKKPERPMAPVKPPRPKAPRRFGPPEGMSWEMALGTYWLPRVGIAVFAMAVVYGLTYVAGKFHDAAWMPYARIGAGLALAGGLIGIGWKLEKKYANYARVLMGGGFGVLYFVLFATWYLPQTRIAPSQEFTLLLLALLVAGWGAIAQWRGSRTVALFMTFMGHFTVALSTLTLETPSRAAIGGLLLLGAGSVWFLYRNGWYVVALTAMAGSYLNQFFWLYEAPPGGGVPEFVGGMSVLTAYLLLFAVAERLTPVPFAAGRQRTRNVYCALNTGGFLVLALALVQSFAFTAPFEYLLYFATALFAAIMGGTYTQRLDAALAPGFDAGAPNAPSQNVTGDPLSSIYFTKASVLMALGFAAWLDGPTVTLSLALESLVLLAAARQSRRPVGRLLSLGAALVAFIHGGYTWITGDIPAYGDPGYYGYLGVALATAAVLYVVAELYRVTPWHTFATRPYAGLKAFESICRDLEMLPATEGARPLPSRMALSHGLAGFGTALAIGTAYDTASERILPLGLAVFAVVVVVLALWRRSAPLLTSTMLLTGVSILTWLQFIGNLPHRSNETLVPLLMWVVPLLALSELVRQYVKPRLAPFAWAGDIQGAWHRNSNLVANALTGTVAIISSMTLVKDAPPDDVLLMTGVLALLASLYAAWFKAANLGLFALLVALATPLSAFYLGVHTGLPWKLALGTASLGVAATGCEKRWWTARPGLAFHQLLPVPYLLYGTFAWWCGWLAVQYTPDRLSAAALAVLAGAIALAMPWLHARAMAAVSTAVLIAGTLFWLGVAPGDPPADAWKLSAFALLAAAVGGDRYFAWRKPFAQPWPGRLLVFCAWVVCLGYNHQVAEGGWHDAGLGFIALGFLAYGALIRGGTAAALSLGTAAFATVPLILNPTSVVSLAQAESSPTGGAIATYQTNYGLFIAYAALILYWVFAERAAFITLARTQFKLREGHEPLAGFALTAVPALLGVLCIVRIDPIHDFYLTLSWTVWALALFGWALVTHQRWYRYMGLAVFGLSLGRAFLVDVWKLKGLYRAGGLLALATALLGVAYGYTRWRASQETNEEQGNTRNENPEE